MTQTIYTYRGHRIVSHSELGQAQLDRLLELFKQPPERSASALEGRSPIVCASVVGIGRVAVKAYTRGGLIFRVSKRHYLRLGKTRCQKEFEMLGTVRRMGVRAPEPIAFAYRGRVAYCGWLLTREVNRSLNLAQLGLVDESRCRAVLAALADQIRGLIENQVVHVDLHPGNVLVDGHNRVYLVDFDRARISGWRKPKLRDFYLSRWHRAVGKHKLPPLLSEGLHAGLTATVANR